MAALVQHTPVIALVSPFPFLRWPLVWDWIQEFPERNLDDYSPQTGDDFIMAMFGQLETVRSWGVEKDGQLVGVINYQPMTARNGIFKGICFTKRAWGRETTEKAVRMVLTQLFSEGVEKVAAIFFADNHKILRFLVDLGAVEEGYLRNQTMRGGVPINMRLFAIFKEDFNADRV